MDSHASWSPAGDRLYFFSERDGHRCLWTQALDPETKAPTGEATAVYHFHRAALTPRNVRRGCLGIAVARDKIVVSLRADRQHLVEMTGNTGFSL
jgi:hypothetical protein